MFSTRRNDVFLNLVFWVCRLTCDAGRRHESRQARRRHALTEAALRSILRDERIFVISEMVKGKERCLMWCRSFDHFTFHFEQNARLRGRLSSRAFTNKKRASRMIFPKHFSMKSCIFTNTFVHYVLKFSPWQKWFFKHSFWINFTFTAKML